LQELFEFVAKLVPRFCLEFLLIGIEAETGNKTNTDHVQSRLKRLQKDLVATRVTSQPVTEATA
jgi:hypothetical protein